MKSIVKTLSLLVTIQLLTLVSCSDSEKNKLKNTLESQHITDTTSKQSANKMKIISSLKRGDSIAYLNLSSSNISEIPDLSNFYIREINLSNNNITEIEVEKFPKNVEKINLENNKIESVFIRKSDSNLEKVKEFNVANNNIESISLGFAPEYLNVSNNNLILINYNDKNIKFLDISNNQNLSNIVSFDPKKVKTIIRNNIANDKPLIAKWRHKPDNLKGYTIKVDTTKKIKK